MNAKALQPNTLYDLRGVLLSCQSISSKGVVAGPGPVVALIEEGDIQEDEADILVVTETMPAAAGLAGQGAEGQGALVRNILQAEKALQVFSHCCHSRLSVLLAGSLTASNPGYQCAHQAVPLLQLTSSEIAQNQRQAWTTWWAVGLENGCQYMHAITAKSWYQWSHRLDACHWSSIAMSIVTK